MVETRYRRFVLSCIMAKAMTTIAYRKLYESSLFSVLDYSCHAHKSDAGEEEFSESNSIVLLRHGMFAKHFAKRNILLRFGRSPEFSAMPSCFLRKDCLQHSESGVKRLETIVALAVRRRETVRRLSQAFESRG